MIASPCSFRSTPNRVWRAGLLLASILIPTLLADAHTLEKHDELPDASINAEVTGNPRETFASGHSTVPSPKKFATPGKSATTAHFLLSYADTAISLEVETGIQPEAGTFTGPGVRDGLFIPSEAGLGTHTVYYEKPGTGSGAPDRDTITIEVRDIPPTRPLPPSARTDFGPRAYRMRPSAANFELQQNTGLLTSMGPSMPFTLELFSGGTGIVSSNLVPAFPIFRVSQVFSPADAGVGMHTFTRSIWDLNLFSLITADVAESLLSGETKPEDLVWKPFLQERIRISVLPNPPPYIAPLVRNYVIEAGKAPVLLPSLALIYPLGGIFTGPGISGDRFDPSAAGIGSHTITYTVDAGTPNAVSSVFTIRVIPTDRITLPERILERSLSAPAESLSSISEVSPKGGQFSGPGVSGGIFSPPAAGLGTHTITYTLPPDGSGMSYSTDFFILVTDGTLAPDSGIEIATARIEKSVSDPAFDIQQTISPAVDGGRFVGPGMVSPKLFSPAHAGLGNHRVQYVITSPDRGPRSVAVTVAVLDKAPATVISAPSYEVIGNRLLRVTVDKPEFPLSGVAGPNVVPYFYGPGTVAHGAASVGFSPAAAGLGIHVLRHTYNMGDPITVQVIPTPPLYVPTALRDVGTGIDATPFAFTNIGIIEPAGGTFSGTGVSGARFNPAAAGLGNFTITYTAPSIAGVTPRTATFQIHVGPVSITMAARAFPASIESPPIHLAAITQVSPAGGTFSGAGVTDGVFNPVLAGLGTHSLRYSITNASSQVSWADFTFTVNLISGRSDRYQRSIFDSPVSLPELTGMLPAGGVFEGPGVIDGVFSPEAAGLGTHIITYTAEIPSPFGGTITDSATFEIVVTPFRFIAGSADHHTFRYDAPAVSLAELSGLSVVTDGTPATGSFSGPGVSGDVFTPSVAGLGTHTISFNVHATPSTGPEISESTSFTIEVTELPPVEVSFLNESPVLPRQQSAINLFDLTGVSPGGGSFSGEGVISGYIIYPPLMQSGAKQLLYTVQVPGRRTPTVAAINVTVVDDPEVTTVADESYGTDIALGSGIGLREAILYAISRGGTQTVTFSTRMAGKTFVLSKSADAELGRTAIRIPAGINLTIRGLDGPAGITIAGPYTSNEEAANPASPYLRLFYIESGATLTLENLTVSGGLARGFPANSGGAGAGLGGAIFNAGTLNLNRTLFTKNAAFGGNVQAAGFYLQVPASPTPVLSSFISPGLSGGSAGGSYQTQVYVDNISQVTAAGFGQGGTLFLNTTPLTLFPTPGGFGGGGSTGGDGGFGGGAGAAVSFPPGAEKPAGRPGFGGGGADTSGITIPSLINLSIGGAGAGMGGAIFNYGGTINITNSTFAENQAIGGGAPSAAAHGSGMGGAVFNLNGVVNATYATMSRNTAANGGGAIYNLGDYGIATQSGPALRRAAATVRLQNSILSDSTDDVADYAGQRLASDGTNTGATASSGDHDIIERNTGGSDAFLGTSSSADPGLLPLANYGGPTRSMLPAPSSPAYRSATPVAGTSTDQRGHLRDASTPDIGAVKVSFLATISPAVASNISTMAATLGSSATRNGTTPLTRLGFVLAPAAVNADPKIYHPDVTVIDVTPATGAFSAEANGLELATAYAFAAFVVSDGVTTYSPTASFETEDLDTDGDTIPNGRENDLGTNPLSIDTDGDGFNDATEILAGSDPKAGISTPAPTHVERVLGFGDARGLDLSGTFLYAINIGSTGATGRAGDAQFTGDDSSSLTVHAGPPTVDWSTREFGTSDENNVLESVFRSVRMSDTSSPDPARRRIEVGLTNLIPGRSYKLQLLFTEQETSERIFDVSINGSVAVTGFKTAQAQGGVATARSAAAIVHEFVCTNSNLTVLLDGSGIAESSDADPYPVLNGLTLEENASVSDDTDADSLTNLQERDLGTDPFSIDTDGDGFNDATEVISGSDPRSGASVPAATHVERVFGYGPARGLDLSGDFLYALDIGSDVVTGRAGDAVFTADNTIGATVTAASRTGDWTRIDFGVPGEENTVLEAVCRSIRKGDSTNANPARRDLQVQLANLIPGRPYKLQLIFAEAEDRDRRFDVRVGGVKIMDDFATVGAQGAGNVGRTASAIVHEFIATDAVLSIMLDGTDVSGGVDHDPILAGLTLEQLPVGDDDADGDQLTNFLESILGTDAFSTDADGDGFNDATELLVGSDPAMSSSIPSTTRIERVLGHGPARGLDLTGSFIYAANVGTVGAAGRADDAVFTADDAPGIALGAFAALSGWSAPEFGDSPQNSVLETVYGSVRRGDATNAEPALRPITVDLANLVPGYRYKLQLLFSETNDSDHRFDVVVEGVKIMDDFSTAAAQGAPRSGRTASAIIHELTATDSVLNIVLDGSDVSGTGNHDPILAGFTLELLPTPPVAVGDSINRPITSRVARLLATDLLANDSDPNGDRLFMASVADAQPPGATVTITGNFVVYTAPATNSGNGSFTYTVSDGRLTATATVSINQTGTVSEPPAIPDSPPNVTSWAIVGEDINLVFFGVPGRTYGIQYTTGIAPPYVWNELVPQADMVAPPSGVLRFTDHAPVGPTRFYRAVLRRRN